MSNTILKQTRSISLKRSDWATLERLDQAENQSKPAHALPTPEAQKRLEPPQQLGWLEPFYLAVLAPNSAGS